jgi:hypothetical protein
MEAIKVQAIPEVTRVLAPDAFARVQGNGRAIAVAKLREYADMLESGALDGCRVEWRDDHGDDTRMRTVTIDRASGRVQFCETHIEEV